MVANLLRCPEPIVKTTCCGVLRAGCPIHAVFSVLAMLHIEGAVQTYCMCRVLCAMTLCRAGSCALLQRYVSTLLCNNRVHWRVLRTERARVLVLHIESAAVVDWVALCYA